ncbi:RICIN domain-containing protein [Streptomyces sp. NPDC001796]|uniref:RICIN domain-containing protein n=1 Tax=Streptomyces sp. NPDC001796 TaxID=3364609 RepID=UPI0036820F74
MQGRVGRGRGVAGGGDDARVGREVEGLGLQNTSSTAASQRWTLTSAGGGSTRLVNGGSGLLAGVAQSSTANGASVIQWNDISVDDQLWKLVRVN